MISLKSKLIEKVLGYFFTNPHESLYVNELSRKFQLDKRNMVKKIKELEAEGILKNEIRGNLKLYSINKNYPLYNEYRRIIIKTAGFEAQLKKVFRNINGIRQAYIYGSYAKDAMDVHSDVDLLVVGSHKIVSLQKILNKLQQGFNREINVINMDEAEFKKRIKKKDPFLLGVLKHKYIRLI